MSTKTCTKCGVEKDVGEFNKNNKSKDGLCCWCSKCRKQYREDNREKIRIKNKQYNEANSEKMKEYYQANRDKIRIKNKEYNDAHREQRHAKQKEYREANRDKIRTRNKEYQEANKEKLLVYAKKYREDNREKILAKQKEHYKANHDERLAKRKEFYEANREEILAKQKEHYQTNRDKILAKMRTPEARAKRNKRIIEDPRYRMECILRGRVRNALKSQGAEKFTSTMDLIGCSPEFLSKRLEKQIKPGTKREDYHVDHIEPCALFDLTKEEEQKMCFHWTNLQLLLGPANQAKSDDVFWSGQVYKPDEVPPEIREEIYAHCRSNMTLRSS
jgi:hypothetical protein